MEKLERERADISKKLSDAEREGLSLKAELSRSASKREELEDEVDDLNLKLQHFAQEQFQIRAEIKQSIWKNKELQRAVNDLGHKSAQEQLKLREKIAFLREKYKIDMRQAMNNVALLASGESRNSDPSGRAGNEWSAPFSHRPAAGWQRCRCVV